MIDYIVRGFDYFRYKLGEGKGKSIVIADIYLIRIKFFNWRVWLIIFEFVWRDIGFYYLLE